MIALGPFLAGRLLPVVVVVGSVGAAAMVHTQPPVLSAATVSSLAPAPSHPEADHMGSTIRANEAAGVAAPVQRSAAPLLASPMAASAQALGNDVSGYQPTVDWGSVAASGGQFAYAKATEGTTYTSPSFASQYNGSAGAGLVRGAYHFGLPDVSSGASQANFFVDNGGGWSADGRTLPPMLDIEYDPYTQQTGHNTCYSLSPGQMVSWIADFSTTVQSRTGRYPLIYTTTAWWNTCTGSNPAFASTNPLFLARYGATPGTMPAGWASQTLWQYSDSGTFPGDQDQFNGTTAQLAAFTTQVSVPMPVHTGGALTAGQALYPPTSGLTNQNSIMIAPNQQYRLYQQSDGNLVEYGNGTAPFNAGTSVPGAHTVMQTDGNLVVYSAPGTPLFNTGTAGNPGAYASLQSDGNLVVYSSDGSRALWAAYGLTNSLRYSGGPAGQGTLTAFEDGNPADRVSGQYLSSPNSSTIALLAGNRLFVGGRNSGATFGTLPSSTNSPLTQLVMQADGNMVLYAFTQGAAPQAVPVWSTVTNGNAGAYAAVQDDGNFVVYSLTGRPLWSSKFGRTY